jgi:hypothetical protein
MERGTQPCLVPTNRRRALRYARVAFGDILDVTFSPSWVPGEAIDE